jgi:hypothetical protein
MGMEGDSVEPMEVRSTLERRTMRRRIGRLHSYTVAVAVAVSAIVTTLGGGATASAASSSYEVPIDINYYYYTLKFAGPFIVGKFVPSASTCVEGHNFHHEMQPVRRPDGTTDNVNTEIIPATKIEIDTSLNCFGKFSVAVYDVSTSQHSDGSPEWGPIRLTVTQVGPRYFVSACTDKHPIASTCKVVGAPVKPTVILHI